jgi:uncharacterized protein YdhG (YjbR/CyaY superfamily)
VALASSAKGSALHTTSQVRAYLASLPPSARSALRTIRSAVRQAAPGVVDGFSYGIPSFKLDEKTLLWYAGWKNHVSVYPLTAGARRAIAGDLARYKTARGTIQFPLTARVPVILVKRIVKARVAELRTARTSSAPTR